MQKTDYIIFSKELIQSLKLLPQTMTIVEAIGQFREQKNEKLIKELSDFIEDFGGGYCSVKQLLSSLGKR